MSEKRKCTHIWVGSETGKSFRKNHPQYTQPGPTHDLPMIGSLFYCKIIALGYAATEAVRDFKVHDDFYTKKQLGTRLCEIRKRYFTDTEISICPQLFEIIKIISKL
ncbi:unnamed protein product [Timema podura]|uniref:Uncharacterized protein n=1 Tax=Timema podura TaxID=61482 RepID=A0ABN7NH65_TIMPD|nr:unnamed protein product [Timema podura]